MADQAPEQQAREFAAAFRTFLEWIHTSSGEENEVSALVRGSLDSGGAGHSVVSRELAPFEQVNLQTALNAWSAAAGRAVQVHGIAMPPHYGDITPAAAGRGRVAATAAAHGSRAGRPA